MAKESPCLEVPVPSAAGKFTTEDMQSLFADITKMTPRDEPAEKAFLASKLQMVRTHPTLDLATCRDHGRPLRWRACAASSRATHRAGSGRCRLRDVL